MQCVFLQENMVACECTCLVFNNFIDGKINIVFLSLFFSDLVPILEHKQQKAVSCLAWR